VEKDSLRAAGSGRLLVAAETSLRLAQFSRHATECPGPQPPAPPPGPTLRHVLGDEWRFDGCADLGPARASTATHSDYYTLALVRCCTRRRPPLPSGTRSGTPASPSTRPPPPMSTQPQPWLPTAAPWPHQLSFSTGRCTASSRPLSGSPLLASRAYTTASSANSTRPPPQLQSGAKRCWERLVPANQMRSHGYQGLLVDLLVWARSQTTLAPGAGSAPRRRQRRQAADVAAVVVMVAVAAVAAALVAATSAVPMAGAALAVPAPVPDPLPPVPPSLQQRLPTLTPHPSCDGGARQGRRCGAPTR
jgi:hypothetical protein